MANVMSYQDDSAVSNWVPFILQRYGEALTTSISEMMLTTCLQDCWLGPGIGISWKCVSTTTYQIKKY